MVKNWALAIGINQYDFLQPLKYAKRDAQLMQEFLCKEAGFERVFFFSDDSPDIGDVPTRPYRANLLRVLRQLFEKPFMDAGDNFWFFFSGHGMRHANQDYLMPSDGDPEDIENTGISINYVTEHLCRSGADNVVLILDACRHQDKTRGEGIGRQTQQASRQTGVISIFSSNPDEYSYEIDTLQKGAFTHALLEGLGIQGQCATVERLNQYLSFRVPEIVTHYKNTQQTPYTIAEPVTKSHLILVPKYATSHDIARLKIDAFQAETDTNLELAEQLWIRVNIAASGSDRDAIKAIQRIAQLRMGLTTLQRTYCNQNSTTSPDLQAGAKEILCSQKGGEKGVIYSPIHGVRDDLEMSTPEIPQTLSDELSSLREVDYRRLRELLADENFQQADQETFALMLKIADREQEGWLDIESINKFPCTDLYTIDQLWLKYSNGRFGFSVQKQIWESFGGNPDADYQTWCNFCDRIGWRVNNNWLFYSDLTFTTDAPEGHFPAAGTVNALTVWGGWAVGLFGCIVGFSSLVSKLRKCNI